MPDPCRNAHARELQPWRATVVIHIGTAVCVCSPALRRARDNPQTLQLHTYLFVILRLTNHSKTRSTFFVHEFPGISVLRDFFFLPRHKSPAHITSTPAPRRLNRTTGSVSQRPCRRSRPSWSRATLPPVLSDRSVLLLPRSRTDADHLSVAFDDWHGSFDYKKDDSV